MKKGWKLKVGFGNCDPIYCQVRLSPNHKALIFGRVKNNEECFQLVPLSSKAVAVKHPSATTSQDDKCQLVLQDLDTLIYGVRLSKGLKNAKFLYSIRLVYKGISKKNQQKIELWTDDYSSYSKWVATLSFILESPIQPV